MEYFNNVAFTDEMMAEIEKLKKNIVKGCLSELPPGFGKENNKRLHMLLNRPMLTGATRIGVKLAVMILMVFFALLYQLHVTINSQMQ